MIIKFTRFATEKEIEERCRWTSIVLMIPDEVHDGISQDLLDYLYLISRDESSPVTKRDSVHGINRSRGDRLRDALVELKLIEIHNESDGTRGGNYRVARLTPEGRQLLRTD
jgi:hypothetical protein